jgi:hypothetical protein
LQALYLTLIDGSISADIDNLQRAYRHPADNHRLLVAMPGALTYIQLQQTSSPLSLRQPQHSQFIATQSKEIHEAASWCGRIRTVDVVSALVDCSIDVSV